MFAESVLIWLKLDSTAPNIKTHYYSCRGGEGETGRDGPPNNFDGWPGPSNNLEEELGLPVIFCLQHGYNKFLAYISM